MAKKEACNANQGKINIRSAGLLTVKLVWVSTSSPKSPHLATYKRNCCIPPGIKCNFFSFYTLFKYLSYLAVDLAFHRASHFHGVGTARLFSFEYKVLGLQEGRE